MLSEEDHRTVVKPGMAMAIVAKDAALVFHLQVTFASLPPHPPSLCVPNVVDL